MNFLRDSIIFCLGFYEILWDSFFLVISAALLSRDLVVFLGVSRTLSAQCLSVCICLSFLGNIYQIPTLNLDTDQETCSVRFLHDEKFISFEIVVVST